VSGKGGGWQVTPCTAQRVTRNNYPPKGVTKRCRSYMSPNAGAGGGVAGSRPMSIAVQYARAQINFGDLIPYVPSEEINFLQTALTKT
jgi:hypothetical protein